jgi:hypothetical protein
MLAPINIRCESYLDLYLLFSRDFIDVREKEESTKRDAEGHGRSLMNRWNNEVGRRVRNQKDFTSRNNRFACRF